MDGHETVVITGGAGFIGTSLIKSISRDRKTQIFCIDDYSSGSTSNHVTLPNVHYREAKTEMIGQLDLPTPSLVFHLGEYSRVEQSFNHPATVWKSNLAGTCAVLEYCRQVKAAIVYAGSSTRWAVGSDGRTLTPYSWAKAVAAELVENYGNWYGVQYSIAYLYNVYGPGEIDEGDYATVIGLFRRRFLDGQPLRVVRPGDQLRNFTHIDDVVRGLVLLGSREDCNSYSFGNPTKLSVSDVAEMFSSEIEWLDARRGNRSDAVLDPPSAAAAAAIGWKAEKKLADYVREIKEERLELAKRGQTAGGGAPLGS